MHKIKIFVITAVVLIACRKEPVLVDNACGVENPTEEIAWLKELVQKAETDTTLNYLGSIYLEEYLEQDVFFVDMMMGSGGVYGYWYNCDGTSVSFGDSVIFPKKDKLIYSNFY